MSVDWKPNVTQTYSRRSKSERDEAKRMVAQAKEKKLLQERDNKAKKTRKDKEQRNSHISYQILEREITGNMRSLKCSKPSHYSPIDSLLTLYQKQIKGNALSRLSVLTKGDKSLEKELLEGNLCILGYPKENNKYNLPMIGYKINEQDEILPPIGDNDTWNPIWKKSVELCFMNISYRSVSYQTKMKRNIQRSNSDTTKEQIEKTNKLNPIKSSQSFQISKQKQEENHIMSISKPIALLHRIKTIKCCSIGIEIHPLCVHQSENEKLFFIYNGSRERKNTNTIKPKIKQQRQSTLPNSHSSKFSSQNWENYLQNHISLKKSNEIDLSHYTKDSLDIPKFSLFSPGESSSNEEENEGYLCILASPLENEKPCASLFISFPSLPNMNTFDPNLCYYDNQHHFVWIILNLRHCLFRFQVFFDSDHFYEINDEIQSKNDSVSFSYFPYCEVNENQNPMEINENFESFLHPKNMDSLDIDRFLYSLINQYSPHLTNSLLQFSTLILSKISSTSVLVQLVFYASYNSISTSSSSFGGNEMVRGGFLFSFDIISGATEILHCIYPVEFTNVESVHEWANRMAVITKSFFKNSYSAYIPNYTWDNNAYLQSTPMKLLPHPTFPFILVNDLLQRVG